MIAARYKFTRARIVYGGGIAVVAAALTGIAACLLPIEPARYLQTATSPEMVDRNGRLMYAFLNAEDQWCFPRPLADISPNLVNATIAAEDQRFRSHRGVDMVAVARAIIQNTLGGGIRSGASTLTMQVVKQADDLPRSVVGKAIQAVRAVRLERHASKDEILEAYLNTAPYGLNLVGCEAASRRYFGKPARELTLPEAATLAGLPKAPTRLMPISRPDTALRRRNHVLGRMLQEGFISEDAHARAVSEPLGAAWHEFPQLAPHLAMRARSVRDGGQRISTTLDYGLQSMAERLAKEELKQFDNEVTNAAIMVVDVASAEVLARVGSADFYRTPGGGQVDACRALRSPGSALKPFTYALAIERNLLYSCEALLDDSLDYGLYNPENYDGKYRGIVSATYALRRSLNVPSIIVLDRLGYDDLYNFLHAAGFSTLIRSADYYGLGLTLGNCEVRLDQLVAGYRMLANLGEYAPLRDLRDTHAASRRILSRGTCVELYTMLEQPLPDEFQRDMVNAVGYVPRVCWKTGTSTGNHDAWAIVFNRQYVVGVWLGNNDGTASKFLVGGRAALPLAARLFRSLPVGVSSVWPGPEVGQQQITVCAASGLPASTWCAKTVTTRISADQFLNRRCDVHYPQSGESGNPLERWPAGAKGWNLAKVRAPINTLELAHGRRDGLQILVPADRAEFVLTQEPNSDRIRLRASADSSVTLHWYLDSRHIGVSGPGQTLLIDLTEGPHTLTCMAPTGETDTVHYTVDAPYTPERFRQSS
ncbi:MAG: penicillin-binding protein 1C [Candidatus Hydrogenedentota bacterium]